MTRDEIKLAAFILFALLAGVGAKHWRTLQTADPSQSAQTPIPQKSAKPPYIFKSPKEARDAHTRSAQNTLE